MPGPDNFDFDTLIDFDLSDSNDDFFSLNDKSEKNKTAENENKTEKVLNHFNKCVQIIGS